MAHPTYNGTALPVYSVGPNWKEKISLRTIYDTIVKEALDLGEERQGRVPRSRFGIRYTTLPLTGQETGYIRRVMELAQALPIIMPVWTEPHKLTMATGLGDNVLQVDDTFPTLLSVLYDYVIVWKDYRTFEVLAVTDFEDNAINLADEVQGAYPVGALVMPILIGKMPRAGAKNITDEHGVATVDFEETWHSLTDQSIVEEYNPLPPLLVGYTDECRAEFTVTESELEEGAIYALEITDDPEDEESWATHIYFMLQGAEEIASGIKVLTINNDYLGAAYFRTVQMKDPLGADLYVIRSQAGLPEASVLAPPDLTVDNLTEISTAAQLAGAGTGGDGLRPLDYYSDGGFILPYSYIEDPLIQTSLHYRRFKRKYGWRQFVWGTMGSLTAPTTGGGHVQPVSVSGPAGATIKWTRDGSDPTLATPAPLSYQGVANNGYVSDHTFAGIFKARCFKDGCRSPLTMVAIDKVMHERPVITTFGGAKTITGYCDLPSGDPLSETANGCTLLWGGPSGFETHMHDIGHSGGTLANSKDPTNGPTLRTVSLNAVGSTYIGLPIWSVGASYFEFSTSEWLGNFNGWKEGGVSHNWATTNIGVIRTQHGITLVGLDGSTRLAWGGDRDAFIVDYLNDIPHSENYSLRLSRFDIVRSPLAYDEPRDVYWASPDDGGIVDIPFDPPAPAVTTAPHDKFETYADGDASAITMDYHTGTDWDAAWVVRAGLAANVGWDLWDGYADGAIVDYDVSQDTDPSWPALDLGEGWYVDIVTIFADQWHVTTGFYGLFYSDTFTGYADGAVAFGSLTGGTGFEAGGAWVTDSSLIEGNEKWDTYADGAFVGAITGTNWRAEAWVSS